MARWLRYWLRLAEPHLRPSTLHGYYDHIDRLCVPKTYATWADVLHLAVGSVSRLVPGQAGGAGRAEGAAILGLRA